MVTTAIVPILSLFFPIMLHFCLAPFSQSSTKSHNSIPHNKFVTGSNQTTCSMHYMYNNVDKYQQVLYSQLTVTVVHALCSCRASNVSCRKASQFSLDTVTLELHKQASFHKEPTNYNINTQVSLMIAVQSRQETRQN